MKKVMALMFILVMFCQVCSALEKLNPDRWEYINEGASWETWLDKNKLFFYRENNDNYADVWTLTRDTSTGRVSLSNAKINLDKKELRPVEDVMYDINGELSYRGKLDEKLNPFRKITFDDQFAEGPLFKKVYEIYEQINKSSNKDEKFAELKAKSDSTDIYKPRKVSFTYINPESDRWYRVDELRDEWIDAQKIWFFKENGNVYADVWRVREDISSEVAHLKFNLTKNEYELIYSVLCERDGSQQFELGDSSPHIIGSSEGFAFSAVLKIYNAINAHKDRDQIFAELKAEAFGTRVFNPFREFLYESQKPKTPVLVKYNIIPSHHKFFNPEIVMAGGAGICVIILLIGIYFYKRRKNNLITKMPENSDINYTEGNQQVSGITLDDIPKLKKMLNDGIITQEDFDNAKAQVFSKSETSRR